MKTQTAINQITSYFLDLHDPSISTPAAETLIANYSKSNNDKAKNIALSLWAINNYASMYWRKSLTREEYDKLCHHALTTMVFTRYELIDCYAYIAQSKYKIQVNDHIQILSTYEQLSIDNVSEILNKTPYSLKIKLLSYFNNQSTAYTVIKNIIINEGIDSDVLDSDIDFIIKNNDNNIDINKWTCFMKKNTSTKDIEISVGKLASDMLNVLIEHGVLVKPEEEIKEKTKSKKITTTDLLSNLIEYKKQNQTPYNNNTSLSNYLLQNSIVFDLGLNEDHSQAVIDLSTSNDIIIISKHVNFMNNPIRKECKKKLVLSFDDVASLNIPADIKIGNIYIDGARKLTGDELMSIFKKLGRTANQLFILVR